MIVLFGVSEQIDVMRCVCVCVCKGGRLSAQQSSRVAQCVGGLMRKKIKRQRKRARQMWEVGWVFLINEKRHYGNREEREE